MNEGHHKALSNGLPRPLVEELIDIYTRAEPQYERARRWRFTSALSHAPSDCLQNLLVTLLLVAIFAASAPPAQLGAWFVAINLVASVRFIVYLLHPRAESRPRQRLERLFILSLAAEGTLWGAAFFLFSAADSPFLTAALLIWLAGNGAWAVSAYTFVSEGVVAFLVAMILPVGIYLLTTGDDTWRLIALGCFLFLPAMTMVSIRNNALIMRGAITQFEKEMLAQALEREKRASDELNNNLAADIRRRERVEADLIEEKNRAEQLALELDKLSSLDGLTGIANRRRFDQTLEREWARAQRAGQPLALVLCDIDYFKQYNDQYGHQAGDACLRQLAKLLETSLRRGGDLAARYGGEEFAILLPGTDSEHARVVAENIRNALFELGLPHEHALVASVLTASFGVAALVPNQDNTPEVLIQRADRALYSAKRAGRNRVHSASADTTPHGAESAQMLH